jgi:hypothetical protein
LCKAQTKGYVFFVEVSIGYFIKIKKKLWQLKKLIALNFNMQKIANIYGFIKRKIALIDILF